MSKIKRLNKESGYRLEEGSYDVGGSFKFVNDYLGHFLKLGVLLMLFQLTSTINTANTGEGSPVTNPFLLIIVGVLGLALAIFLTGFQVYVSRSVGEKMSERGLGLSDTSIRQVWNKETFMLGLKYTVSSLILGIFMGIIVFIVFFGIGMLGFISIGTMGSGSTDIGAFVGGVLLTWVVGLIVGVLFMAMIIPFVSPIKTLYTYYGEELGIFEAVGMSLNIGWSNYWKLFVLNLKTTGLTILGALMFGVGLIYMLPIVEVMTLKAYSEIFGVKIVNKRKVEEKEEVIKKEGDFEEFNSLDTEGDKEEFDSKEIEGIGVEEGEFKELEE